MTLRDLVAFSFVPASPRRKHTALLGLHAAGLTGPDTLDLLLTHCWRRPVGSPAALLTGCYDRADAALESARSTGIRPVGRLDPVYPPALAATPDAPLVLWVHGDVTALQGRLVAIVGSRAASPYGEEAAARLAQDLACEDVVIVSGLARGCDAAAHRGALAGRGRTVAVLGCGPDVCYPPEHEALLGAVRTSGAVVSEHPPGTPPKPGYFPLRNRIISGLSAAVVVVEASERSGSLITAGCALEHGREVMAVPGSVFGVRHRGSHALLRDGATLVETGADVREALGWGGGARRGPAKAADPLLQKFPAGEDVDVDTLVRRTGWPAPLVLGRLLELELAGVVRRAPGGRFVRANG